MDSEIEKYLENLSKKLNSNSDNPMHFFSPQGSEEEIDNNFLNFLKEHRCKLFTNTWCFRPPLANLAIIYCKGEYITLVRPIKNSEMALWLWLLRTESCDGIFKETTYQISIAEFNLAKTLPADIRNYAALKNEHVRLVNSVDVFSQIYSKIHYGEWLEKIINFFRKDKKIGLKNAILAELQLLEEEMRLFVNTGITTIKT